MDCHLKPWRQRAAFTEPLEQRTLLSGYTLQTSINFAPYLNGSTPKSDVIVDSSGDVFGTTSAGGVSGDGIVYELSGPSHTLKQLYSFSGTDGTGPAGSLAVDSAGNIYGITTGGGSNSTGTLFCLSESTGDVTVLASFPAAIKAGSFGLTIDGSDNLYGINNTAIYRYSPDGAFTSLYQFSTSLIGLPSVLADAGGNLFVSYNASYAPTLAKLPVGASSLVTVTSGNSAFSSYYSLTFDSSGNLFGLLDGNSVSTSIFKVAASNSAYSTLTTLNSTVLGHENAGLAVDASDNVFGFSNASRTTAQTSYIYELKNGSTSVTVLATPGVAVGAEVAGALTLDSAGDLFGATQSGTNDNQGTVFELAAGATAVGSLAAFTSIGGGLPAGVSSSALAADMNGDIFGLTTEGGDYGFGTLYEVTRGSTTSTTIYSLPTTANELAFDPFGNLFGLYSSHTSNGIFNNGGIFEMPAGTTSVQQVIAFDGNEYSSNSCMPVFDSAGDMFFSTEVGGTSFEGSILELPHNATALKTVANFTSKTVGYEPVGNIAIDASGNIYGVCTTDGANNGGSIFELAAGKTVPVSLFAFSSTDSVGSYPVNGITRGANGDLYGTTGLGTDFANGAIFEYSPSYKTMNAVEDSYREIKTPFTADAFGDEFGSAPGNSASNGGVFEISGVTTLTGLATLSTFDPPSGLVVGPDGRIYGTQVSGGSAGAGDLFSLTPTNLVTLTQQPMTAIVGKASVTPLKAAVYDASNAIFAASHPFRVAIASGPAGGSLANVQVTSDSTGVATFPSLTFSAPGTYVLNVSAANALSATTVVITVTGGTATGSVSGTASGAPTGEIIFLDANNNGARDTGELSTTISSAGAFSFATVPAGSYVLRQVLAAGFTQTTPASNGGISVTVSAGSNSTGEMFVDTLTPTTGSVAGTVTGGPSDEVVYLDSNGDGSLDNGELSTTTSSTGAFGFASVPAGSYVLRQVLAAGYTQTTPAGNAGIAVSVSAGSALTDETFVDTAIPMTGSVTGTVTGGPSSEVVFLDANGNGSLDGGELSTKTSTTGAFSFASVPIGSYVLQQILNTGYSQTSPTGNAGITLSVSAGAVLANENFTDAATGGSVSGTVTGGLAGETIYVDANNNSKLDAGELSTTTDATGTYTIAAIPAGAVIVRQLLTTGYTQTTPSGGLGIHVTVSNGGSVTGQNFVDKAPATTGSVAGTVTGGVAGETVYLDANNNSVSDASELSTTTASTGAFSFANVPAGSYVLAADFDWRIHSDFAHRERGNIRRRDCRRFADRQELYRCGSDHRRRLCLRCRH